jgi:hypothetical protein
MYVIDGAATDVRPRSRTKRRLLQLLTGTVVVSGAIALTAVPASAAQTCTGRTDSNLCLSIDRRPDGNYAVHVGIDVHMPLEQAQEYVDDAGVPFGVWLRGDDGYLNEYLAWVPITDLVATAESGLSADFDTVVSGRSLDEDHGGTDEVRARVTLVDTDTNTVTGVFDSNRLVGNWPS